MFVNEALTLGSAGSKAQLLDAMHISDAAVAWSSDCTSLHMSYSHKLRDYALPLRSSLSGNKSAAFLENPESEHVLNAVCRLQRVAIEGNDSSGGKASGAKSGAKGRRLGQVSMRRVKVCLFAEAPYRSA